MCAHYFFPNISFFSLFKLPLCSWTRSIIQFYHLHIVCAVQTDLFVCLISHGLIQITVQKPVKEGQEEAVDLSLEQTNCEVCGASDREDRLLLCDGCDAG